MRLMNFKQLLVLLFCFPIALIAQKKDDAPKFLEANYEEAKTPDYDLPELMVSFSNKQINNVKAWEEERGPELYQFFEKQIYGKVPTKAPLIQSKVEIMAIDTNHLEGLCTRKDVKITLSNRRGAVEMALVLFIPNAVKKPVPAIYWLNNEDIRKGRFNMEGPQRFGMTKNGVPLKQLMLRGIALAGIDVVGVSPSDKENGKFLNGGIVDLFLKEGQKDPASDEWGLLATWSYALSRGMDYLLTDSAIRADQVAVLGVSKMGKAALWAAASDPRFAMVLSSHSGHGGDALWKREYGETLANMTKWLPRWLCENSHQYANNIETLPVDQHMLLGLIAPRPIYLATSIHDLWADPKGQYLSAFHSAKAFKLYGKQVKFKSEDLPSINQPIIESSIGHHVRSGFHGMKLYDWEQFMKFVEYHFMEITPRSVQEVYYPNGQFFNHFPNKGPKKRDD